MVPRKSFRKIPDNIIKLLNETTLIFLWFEIIITQEKRNILLALQIKWNQPKDERKRKTSTYKAHKT